MPVSKAEYQILFNRTDYTPQSPVIDVGDPRFITLAHAMAGLEGEHAEFVRMADYAEQVNLDDLTIDREAYREELISEAGDVLWYACLLTSVCEPDTGLRVEGGIDLDGVLEAKARVWDFVKKVFFRGKEYGENFSRIQGPVATLHSYYYIVVLPKSNRALGLIHRPPTSYEEIHDYNLAKLERRHRIGGDNR